jgi:hypothetical protein
MTTTRTRKQQAAEPEIDEQQQFVTTVAGWLNETRDEPRAQIALVVRTIGTAKTMDLLKEVLAIENAGGMQALNKTKRRSVGGVFFHLVKQRYGKELPPAFWMLRYSKRQKAKALGKVKTALNSKKSYSDKKQTQKAS